MEQLIFLALMVAVFYFLLIRPQQRRVKQHQQLVGSLNPGDEVLTVGGLYGSIVSLDESLVRLEVAPGTVIRCSRQAISRRVGPEPAGVEEAPELEDAGESKSE